MALQRAIDEWGSTADERARRYACDDEVVDPGQVLFRAVSIAAPPSVVFRWLCQLKAAPYSYDLLDNRGHRSPQHLVPGLEDLAVGEPVLIFELASFVRDEHLTLVVRGHRAFGDVAITYAVFPDGAGTRLVAKVVATPIGGLLGAVLRRVLPLGDLVMMRRQLLNLKALAESS